jgi:hypothetical protein
VSLFILLASLASASVTVGEFGDYATIDEALANVGKGETVTIAAGVYLEALTISQDVTLQGAGEILTTIGSPGEGTNVVFVDGAKLHLQDLSIDGMAQRRGIEVVEGILSASNVAFVDTAPSDGKDGGSLLANNSEVALEEVSMVGEVDIGAADGGHVAIHGGIVDMDSVTISNGAAVNGGGIVLTDATASFYEVTLSFNHAQQAGAIASYASDVLFENGLLSDNSSGVAFGTHHLYFEDGSTEIVLTTVDGTNTDGGVIRVNGDASFNLMDTLIEDQVGTVFLGGATHNVFRNLWCGNTGTGLWAGGGESDIQSNLFVELQTTSLLTDGDDVQVINNTFIGSPGGDTVAVTAGVRTVFTNNLVMGFDHPSDPAVHEDGGVAIGSNNAFWDNSEHHTSQNLVSSLFVDPMLVQYDEGDCEIDARPHLTSALIDHGLLTILDPDLSHSDIGATGGEQAHSDLYIDADHDGYAAKFDCDEVKQDVHQGAPQLCDGVDNNCDGDDADSAPFTWYVDTDGDGYGAAADGTTESCTQPTAHADGLYVAASGDCEPDNWGVNPGALDLCDGVNNDCAGNADDDDLLSPIWYSDEGDGDDYGDPDFIKALCTQPIDYVGNSDDCEPFVEDINPGEEEVCNGVDDNCDEDVDEGLNQTWYADNDKDLYGNPDASLVSCYDEAPHYVLDDTDCDDDDDEISPGWPEVCDNIDHDCDLVVDNGVLYEMYYADKDLDGAGAYGTGSFVCHHEPDEVNNESDCDDDDDEVSELQDEVCDGKDNDCDNKTDEGPKSNWFLDLDNDAYGDEGSSVKSCSQPDDYVASAGDCDDSAKSVHPDADELCNGEDDDCDGTLDNGLTENTYYFDGDEDLHGDPNNTIVACSVPNGYRLDDEDCDDSDDSIHWGAFDHCEDGVDQDCNGIDASCGDGVDDDGDGFCDGTDCIDPAELPGDCDDTESAINPWVSDICNGVDDDCDGVIDNGLSGDLDGDGHRSPTDCEQPGDDCDDFNSAVNPDQEEVCNGLDDNCDGVVDDGLQATPDVDQDGVPGNGACVAVLDCDDDDGLNFPGNTEIVDGQDNDCDGLVDEDEGTTDGDGDGYCESTACSDSSNPGDCDDTDAAVSPAASEVLDGIDNDCNGTIDDLAAEDEDNDGHKSADGDCNDFDSLVYPGAFERCNGLDDDCDGVVDVAELDIDRDGVRICDTPKDCDDLNDKARPYLAEDCSDGIDNDCDGTIDVDADNDLDGITTCSGDCRDVDPDVHPGALELCNQLDDDCDGHTDEGFDLDADGFQDCAGCGGEDCDCEDVNALIHPGAPEVCGDGQDNDCDGSVDQSVDADLDGWGTCDGDCDDGAFFTAPNKPERCDGVDNNCDGQVDEGFDQDEDGFVVCGGDCDDLLAVAYPLHPEVCDGIDNDCNDVIDDDFPDVDEDGVYPCGGDCDDDDPEIAEGLAEICDDNKDNDCDELTDGRDEDCGGLGDTADDTLDSTLDAAPAWFCGHAGGAPAWLVLATSLLARRRRISVGSR